MTNAAKDSSRHELLTSLQGGRAIAAVLVIFYHASLYIFALDKYWGYDPVHHFFDFGHAGVKFFFVLSGFIIFYIHRKDLGQPDRFFSYAIKRFLRIYPIYWIVLAVVVPVYFLVPSFGFPYHRQWDTILSSILLVHINGNSNTDLAVAWTLYHEILFYCLFSLAIISKRLGLAVIVAWLLASAFTLVSVPDSYPMQFLFSPLHLLFGMGMFACWLVTAMRIPSPRLIFLVGAAIFLAAGMEEDYLWQLDEMPRNMLYGLGSMLMVAGMVELEHQGRFKVPAVLLLMGNASYVIYLINFTILSLLAKIFIYAGAREAFPASLSYMLLAALSVVFGILIHWWIEKPVLRFLKTRLRKKEGGVSGNSKAYYMKLGKAFGALVFALVTIVTSSAAWPADVPDTAASSSSGNRSSSSGRDVFGNLIGTDVQGNPNDKNSQGNRPKDAQGNVPKDIYGNKTGSDNK